MSTLARVAGTHTQLHVCALQVSPMVQAYLRTADSTAGRRPERMALTVPVRWCDTGGADTFRCALCYNVDNQQHSKRRALRSGQMHCCVHLYALQICSAQVAQEYLTGNPQATSDQSC
jgi:hypothetical protein